MMGDNNNRVVFQPATYAAMQRGISQIVDAVRPTLGPQASVVAVARPLSSERPELLDSGAMIARRIIEVSDRDEDMGAMYVRNLMWRVHELVGDGTVSAAVFFQAILSGGIRQVVAGTDALELRLFLECGAQVLIDQLATMAVEVVETCQLTQVAESLCNDAELAALLGEAFTVVGPFGQVDIRDGHRRESYWEYTDGAYWSSGIHSVEPPSGTLVSCTEHSDCAILITDLDIANPQDLFPLLSILPPKKVSSLVVFAMRFSNSALHGIESNLAALGIQSIAVTTPGVGETARFVAMQDIAELTGGRPVVRMAGQTLQSVALEDLGWARRTWADQSSIGIWGGKGDVTRRRQRIDGLRKSIVEEEDPAIRATLRERLGRFMGGYATLWVGGKTKTEISQRKEVASRTGLTLRTVLTEGTVPGGGVALLSCRSALLKVLDGSDNSAERAAYEILVRSIEELARTIATNAGLESNFSYVLDQLDEFPPGFGLDARSGKITHLAAAGILDSVAVTKTVVQTAISAATMALTVDVLVHRSEPEIATQP